MLSREKCPKSYRCCFCACSTADNARTALAAAGFQEGYQAGTRPKLFECHSNPCVSSLQWYPQCHCQASQLGESMLHPCPLVPPGGAPGILFCEGADVTSVDSLRRPDLWKGVTQVGGQGGMKGVTRCKSAARVWLKGNCCRT
jgi:hypothetical protein